MHDFFDGFPELKFIFNKDKVITWFPEDYLIKTLDKGKILYCPGMKKLNNIVLGATFMRNYDILFNKVEKTITFARSDCSNSKQPIRVNSSSSKRKLDKFVVTKSILGQEIAPPNTFLDNFSMFAFAPNTVSQESSNKTEIIKLKPDFYGFTKDDNSTKFHVNSNTDAGRVYLKYYVIVFAILVCFLILLMIRLLMFDK